MDNHKELGQKIVDLGYNVVDHIDDMIHGITFSIPEAIDHSRITNTVRNCASYITKLVTGEGTHGE